MATPMECTICFGSFVEAEPPFSSTLCGHFFHTACLRTWQEIPRTDCPACRRANVQSHLCFPKFARAEEGEEPSVVAMLRQELASIQEERDALKVEKERGRVRYDELHEQYDFHVMTLMREEGASREENTRLYREIEQLRLDTRREMRELQANFDAMQVQHRTQVAGLKQESIQVRAQNELLSSENSRQKESSDRCEELEMEGYRLAERARGTEERAGGRQAALPGQVTEK